MPNTKNNILKTFKNYQPNYIFLSKKIKSIFKKICSEETIRHPESFHCFGHFYYMNITKKCSKKLVLGKTAFPGSKMIFT